MVCSLWSSNCSLSPEGVCEHCCPDEEEAVVTPGTLDWPDLSQCPKYKPTCSVLQKRKPGIDWKGCIIEFTSARVKRSRGNSSEAEMCSEVCCAVCMYICMCKCGMCACGVHVFACSMDVCACVLCGLCACGVCECVYLACVMCVHVVCVYVYVWCICVCTRRVGVGVGLLLFLRLRELWG